MSHLARNRSNWRRVSPGHRLHRYWQSKTRKQNTTYIWNTKNKQKKTCPSKTKQTKPWYDMHYTNSAQEMQWVLFLQTRSPHEDFYLLSRYGLFILLYICKWLLEPVYRQP